MFHLGSPGPVQGGVGPPVLQEPDLPPVSLAENRFYGEHHPWLHLPGVGVQTVVDVRGTVEEGADTVAKEDWNHTESLFLGKFVN